MTASRSRYLSFMGREFHVTEWGREDAPALVMWHGLARTGRDFDTLAAHLADRYRIVCPDTLGRGLSGWSRAPRRDYTLESYVRHAVGILDGLGIDRLKWVGTSMGGALGMLLAAGPLKGRLERLVINDIGPSLNPAAVERIRDYLNLRPSFKTMVEFEAFLRRVYTPYGFQTDAEWRRMAETSVRRLGDGRYVPHYDPEVMRVFAATAGDYEMWSDYDRVACPTLVLRGAESDLLLPQVAEEMTRRGPMARLETIPGCGHAPCLNVPDQIRLVEDFLAG
jgi:pimeloyl-ACP methyl ester carboxylesterase